MEEEGQVLSVPQLSEGLWWQLARGMESSTEGGWG